MSWSLAVEELFYLVWPCFVRFLSKERLLLVAWAVLLASPDVRRALRRLIEGTFPEVAVLTFTELDPELQIRPVGRLVAAANR